MIDSCILDVTKKPSTDVTGQIVLFDHSKPCFIDIIAQSHAERNKIFILLRSQEPMKNQGCVPCEPLRCPLRPRQLRRRACVNVLARNKILVLCRWAAAHSHMNNRFLSNGGILLSFFDFLKKKSLFSCQRTFSFPQSCPSHIRLSDSFANFFFTFAINSIKI